MKSEKLLSAFGGISDNMISETAEAMARISGVAQPAYQKARRPVRRIAAAVAAVLVLALGAFATAMAFSEDFRSAVIDAIVNAFSDAGITSYADPELISRELNDGQWIYLDEDRIAVIVPETPAKVLISDNAGATWKRAVVEGSDKWDTPFCDLGVELPQYYGGYIGFYGKKEGFLVLTSGGTMNDQYLRIYLTSDTGMTWTEIGNPYSQHISTLTGAGFASDKVGFISYCVYYDTKPDIWWTKDGGATWKKLEVVIPQEYSPDKHIFTPLSPAFSGKEGTYPIVVGATADEPEKTIYMRSHDGGLTWSFD